MWFVLTFAAEPSTMLYGSKAGSEWNRSWNQPIKRGLTVV